MRFEVCGRQSQGGREYQEDSWLISTPDTGAVLNDNAGAPRKTGTPLLVVLSDGIGSGGHGDVASQFIVTRFRNHLKEAGCVSPEALRAAITRTDKDLSQLKKDKGYGRSMGGTLVAGCFDESSLTFLSVGDSHLFRFRDDEIHYMNEKHRFGSEQDELAGLGRKAWPEALRQYGRSSITSAVIGSGIEICQVATRDVRPGDLYIFASDGVDTIDGELLRRLVSCFQGARQPEALDTILTAVDETGKVNEGGEHDNTTLVMVRCEARPAEARDSSRPGSALTKRADASLSGNRAAWTSRLPGFALLAAVLLFALLSLSFWPSIPM